MGSSNVLSSRAAFVHSSERIDYPTGAPFDSPERYPEMRFRKNIDKSNRVYPAVRELFMRLGMDGKHAGTAQWNPLKEIVKPGDTVVIKPNLVTHRHYLGREALYGSIIHGSVLRPIVDYVRIALGEEGSIIIADNPVEGADFGALMNFTGIERMVDLLNEDGCPSIRLLDLRPRVLREDRAGRFRHESQQGDPLGYIEIDLSGDSCFAVLDDREGTHYYTLADPSIDHFDPRFVGKSKTDEYHHKTRHAYLVSRTVLAADAIINVAKLKTHCKAGASLTLKNMIGMVYQKDCMPHHRPGTPPLGDSFPQYPARHYTVSRRVYKRLRETLQIHRVPGFRRVRDLFQEKGIVVGQHIEHGNWKGNDTIWRTILDLNRIALYADKSGKMKEVPQRRFLCLIDGVVAQEGEGPMCGVPRADSLLIGGYNPVAVDELGIQAMGIKTEAIKAVAKAPELFRWKIAPADADAANPLRKEEIPNLRFRMPKGWM